LWQQVFKDWVFSVAYLTLTKHWIVVFCLDISTGSSRLCSLDQRNKFYGGLVSNLTGTNRPFRTLLTIKLKF